MHPHRQSGSAARPSSTTAAEDESLAAATAAATPMWQPTPHWPYYQASQNLHQAQQMPYSEFAPLNLQHSSSWPSPYSVPASDESSPRLGLTSGQSASSNASTGEFYSTSYPDQTNYQGKPWQQPMPEYANALNIAMQQPHTGPSASRVRESPSNPSGNFPSPAFPSLPSQRGSHSPSPFAPAESSSVSGQSTSRSRASSQSLAPGVGAGSGIRKSPSRSKLDEENRLLLHLRDQRQMPWKDITAHFDATFRREYRMATLQMRYGRLKNSAQSQKNRARSWTDADTAALQRALEWHAAERFELVSEKMAQFGATQAWSSAECSQAYQVLRNESSNAQQPSRFPTSPPPFDTTGSIRD